MCTATSRQLRSTVASIDINDRHEAQRVHTFAGKQLLALSTNALTSTRTRLCLRPSPCMWTAWKTRKTVRETRCPSTWHSGTSHGMGGRRNFERKATLGHREASFHCAFIRRCSPTDWTKTGSPLETSWEKSSVRLVSYGGTLINQLGVYTLTCAYQQTRRETRFLSPMLLVQPLSVYRRWKHSKSSHSTVKSRRL